MTAQTKHSENLDDAGLRVVFDSNGQIAKFIHPSGVLAYDFAALLADLVANATWLATTNSVAPAVTPGTATTGTVMSCTTGTWSHVPTAYTYQWQRAGVDLSGKTSPTYAIVAGDLTHAITCNVAATNRAGTATAVASNGVTPA